MSIGKHEYYEGAALHLLIREGNVRRLIYRAPFFIANDDTFLLLKHSTKNRSPWSFTFAAQEQRLLSELKVDDTIIGLVCGHDGVAALSLKEYLQIAPFAESAIHIACARKHREQYELSGPRGLLGRKIAPSYWARVLNFRGEK